MKKNQEPVEILIAEGSPAQAAQLQTLLEKHKYKVTAAANGKVALDLLARHRPALVISDVVMPELDGFGLCKAIKSDARLKHIPVMLVTTLSDPDDVIRGLECGVDNFIRKPYEEKYLLSRINYLLMNVEQRKNQRMQMALEINLGGNKHSITAERQQILELLVSTYEQAVHINSEIKEREQQLAHSNQVLQGLNYIAEGLNGAVSEKMVAEMALQRALELPGIQAGWMFLRDGENGFRLAGACNLPPALDTPNAFDGDCICQQRLLSGELDSVTNITKCKRLAETEGGTEGLCCHATVPLWLGPDQLLGVMNLVGAGNGLFSESELKVLYSVGHQVAVALERARLHENLEALVVDRTARLTAEIEERKRIEQEQARLVAIIEATPDMIGMAAPDGRLLYTNQAGLSLMGIREEDMPRIRIPDVHPEWAARLVLEEGIPHALSQGCWKGETAVLGADGREIPVLQVILAHKGTDGTVEYLSTIARDITQRKESEARIARLNRIYAVLSGINTTIVRVREEEELIREACRIAVEHGRFTFAWIGRFDADTRQVTPVAQAGRDDGYLARINLFAQDGIPGSCTLTTQALTSTAPAVCNDIARDARMDPWRDVASDRGYRSVAVFPLLLEGQPWGMFALYAPDTNVFDDQELKLLIEMSGDIGYALGNLRVEARRRQAEVEIRELNEELEQRVTLRTVDLEQARHDAEQANVAKSAFLATMSHEIRTPMNGVIGMVDVLVQSSLTAHQSELVSTIRDSAGALLGIIDDILDFSKIEAGRMDLEHVPVSLGDIVEGLCNSLVPIAARKGVDLTLFVSPDIPERVLSDDVRLRQLLYNLVGNAIKFSSGQPGTRGRVSIRVDIAQAAPLRLTLSVADNGIGMSPETVHVLFMPFTQAEVSTTRHFGGTGLGLTICKRLADLMGGEIAVESTLGTGSVFSVTLPFEVPAEQPVRSQPDISGLDCILVESPAFNADDLRAYLEHAGARVRQVADVTAAAEAAGRAAAPAVVILEAKYASAHCAELDRMPNAQCLLITHGRRRRARVEGDNTVTLDGDALRRMALLRAVAVAVGRASPEIIHERHEESRLGGDEPPPTIAEARARNRLILVAEDDDINQKVILQQLALLGHAAEIARNGTEALRMWREGRYALLLTDLHMPEMDGYGLAETIRREEAGRCRMPILALTANVLRGEANRAREAGMDEYLTKPVQLPALRAVLEKWLSEVRIPATPDLADAAAATDRAPLLDVGVLKGLVGDDPDTVREFLTDYHAMACQLAEEMRATLATGDVQHTGAIAHRLKSSSRSVGAMALGDLCAELENACRTGNKAALPHGMQSFETALAGVTAAITRLLAHDGNHPGKGNA